jgi:hypothetical protein
MNAQDFPVADAPDKVSKAMDDAPNNDNGSPAVNEKDAVHDVTIKTDDGDAAKAKQRPERTAAFKDYLVSLTVTLSRLSVTDSDMEK